MSASCADGESLGARRRALVSRVALAGAVALAAGAVLLALPAPLSNPEVSERLAWGASVWGLPLLLGEARTALVGGRVGWGLVLGLIAFALGIAGVPLATALFVCGWRALVAIRGGEANVQPVAETLSPASAKAPGERP